MEEEWKFFEKLIKGSKTQALVDRNNNQTSSINFVSNQHGINSKISELSKKVDLLLRNLGKGAPSKEVMESMETVHKTTHYLKVTIQDDAVILTSVGKMTTIALTISNNKTMVTNKDFVTDDEIFVKGKKADNVKFDSELDLCTQKRKLKATFPKKINLTEHVSVVLSSSLPTKFKDPGASLISAVVGNITIKKALLDLDASINILPAIEFFVMDIESPYKDVQPTIIIGRPFLATIDARINGRAVPWVDVIDEEVKKHTPHMLKDDPLDLYETGENEDILDVTEVQEIQECLVSSLDHQRPPWSYKVDPLPANFDTATKPSLEVPPTLELKPLPTNLKYAFLGPNNTLPVIVASDLSGSLEEALLKVLSKYKAAV
uniref:Reverse transcriptase domain-containing protein n=1 Tax=Tanacetum cinerariifolium TaxID=118510 RepID=A0A6L2P2Q7_TANCI|nr:hypothetical protein [Tanacetum cinerariifolium]